ncbi:CBS domain-containing protein [Streptomyces sp. x-19]|uniref:CBS domain-containing protein n=1 Tax=Streptomyces sp. x-19 TaxID=2789280 RepID=UPI00397FBA92
MPVARDIMTPGAECVGAEDSVLDTVRKLTDKVRRLPVIDGNRLVGMVALADVARTLPDPQVGDLLEALSTP